MLRLWPAKNAYPSFFRGILNVVLRARAFYVLIRVTMLPGKRKMEAKMIGQPAVLSTINNMRQKFGQPPLTIAPKP